MNVLKNDENDEFNRKRKYVFSGNIQTHPADKHLSSWAGLVRTNSANSTKFVTFQMIINDDSSK